MEGSAADAEQEQKRAAAANALHQKKKKKEITQHALSLFFSFHLPLRPSDCCRGRGGGCRGLGHAPRGGAGGANRSWILLVA
ncbi:hypothetical protein SORBI_3005G106000 [Sorghum bicolor]|uniref:Uncharacterized protein n=1 Tax=Sorghum bicolor TaxID=4558 RepID=A0A1B6PRH0_SORBI|nr:hypothetical protein SORBI_3005G106000 [Sorghum bicolor]